VPFIIEWNLLTAHYNRRDKIGEEGEEGREREEGRGKREE
jgi:hypothetical protein